MGLQPWRTREAPTHPGRPCLGLLSLPSRAEEAPSLPGPCRSPLALPPLGSAICPLGGIQGCLPRRLRRTRGAQGAPGWWAPVQASPLLGPCPLPPKGREGGPDREGGLPASPHNCLGAERPAGFCLPPSLPPTSPTCPNSLHRAAGAEFLAGSCCAGFLSAPPPISSLPRLLLPLASPSKTREGCSGWTGRS